MLFTKKYYVNVTEGVDVISVIHDLKYAVRDSKSSEGLLTAIIPDAGAGLVLMPNITEAIDELKVTMDMFGSEAGRGVDQIKRERDIGPIIQSSILGRTIHLPFREGKFLFDPYDDVFFVDFMKKVARKEFIVQIVSEAPPAEGAQAGKGKPPGGGKRG